MKSDFTINYQGSITILIPWTQAAKEWIDLYVSDDVMWFGAGIVIEHRYVDDILSGIFQAELTVSDPEADAAMKHIKKITFEHGA